MNAINRYNLALDRRPIITKALTATGIFAIGDYLCQELEIRYFKKGDSISLQRIAKQASFGIVSAPYLHLQYCKIVPHLFPPTVKYAFAKSVLYAVVVSDCFFNLFFFSYMSLAGGKTVKETFSTELMDKFVPVQTTNMQVWPFLTGFNFYFNPAMYRVLFDNFLCIFWNIYLSYVENNNLEKSNRNAIIY